MGDDAMMFGVFCWFFAIQCGRNVECKKCFPPGFATPHRMAALGVGNPGLHSTSTVLYSMGTVHAHPRACVCSESS